MTKSEKVMAYNELYPDYHITGIKKMTQEQINSWKAWSEHSLDDLYKRPSQAKVNSNRELLDRYEPREVLGYTGNSMTYSVMLVAKNGSILHITKGNNWLVEVA